MKLRVTDLPQEGTTITNSLSKDGLNIRLQEGHSSDIEITQDPQVSLTLTPLLGESALVQGTINTTYRQQCGRCADPLERALETSITYNVRPRHPDHGRSLDDNNSNESDVESVDGELGVIYYEGDQVDLTDSLQESIIVGFDPFWSPVCDAQGKCSMCRRDAPEKISASEESKVTFGDLLKIAQVKKR